MSDSPPVAIQARSLSKSYHTGRASVRALRGVSLDVRYGEVTLLRGPSGSGKTTLLSVFGCILAPDAGDLWLDGQDVRGLDEQRMADFRLNHIGFVFQGFNLFPTLRAWENVAIALDLRRVKRREARARAFGILERLDIGNRAEFYPEELSGGQKQRVAVARAIVGEPPILLADEPTASLDGDTGRTILEILRTLASAENRAVVIVTHDERAVEFADRVVTLKDGIVVSDVASPGTRVYTFARRELTPPDDAPESRTERPGAPLRRVGV